MYNYSNNDLKINKINILPEIIKGNKILKNKDMTIFNSSCLPLKNSSDILIASRGWYGNIRSWDGINYIILSIFNKNYKKKYQNIIDFDDEVIQNNMKFKQYKRKIIIHKKTKLDGPEDPRLFYFNNDIYILINELQDNKRLMFLATIDLSTLNYNSPKSVICRLQSTVFEKNWGPFIYKKKMHMLYDINPLKILEVDPDYKCKLIINKKNNVISSIEKSFGDLKFHLRNSTNLIKLKNNYLGMGHAVLEYKNDTDINKLLIPSIDNSQYSKFDKGYFKRFYKLYLGFFYILDMKKGSIIKLSPFFQLPSNESKQELIFFPTSIHLENELLNISYSLGDNRSYIAKIHFEVVKQSLYNMSEINIHQNFNINPNYFQELIRNLRVIYGY